ncbi:hypothetical protein [Streptomyces albidochromogenes]|uniref:Uncharacterized protein n=1 Tax=Streptomyces albidochromogenes TaxID=329524 RepID=A0ABW6FK66_9ACTN
MGDVVGESANDDIWILWIGAAGFVLALNVRGAAERFFDLVARQMPFTGSATPKTLRIVGGGWIAVGSLMLLPDLIGLGRTG